MNNWDIKTLVEYIINKEQSGNMFSASEFESALNKASFMLLRAYLGNVNSPDMTAGSNKTFDSIASISTFIEEAKKIKLVNGIGSIPEDYYEHSMTIYNYITNTSCGSSVIPVMVQLLANSEYDSALSSSLLSPSYSEPIMKFASGKVYVYPRVKEVYMNYVREPRRAVIALDPAITDYEAYDAANSVELEWSDKDKYRLITLILKDAGVNLKDQAVLQYAQQIDLND